MNKNFFQFNQEFIEYLINSIVVGITNTLNLNNSQRWVNEDRAKELLNCQKSKLAALRASNQILFSKTGSRNIMYCSESIEKFLIQNSNQTYYGN